MHRVDLATIMWASVVIFAVLYVPLRVIVYKITSWPSYKSMAFCQGVAAVPTALACWFLYDVFFAIGSLGVQAVVMAFRQYILSHNLS